MPEKQSKKRKNNFRLAITYTLGFILAISVALPAYIQSNFLKQFVSLEILSLFFIIANTLTIIAILFFPDLIKRLSNYFMTKIVLLIYFISLLGLVMAKDAATAFASIILFSVANSLIWINMDVLLENFSPNSNTGKIRTTYLTFINFGWILAPTFSGYLVNNGGYYLTFLISAIVIIPFFLIFIFHGRKLQDHNNYPKQNIATTFTKMWRNKNLRGVFFVALLLSLFYSCAVVYIPLYLHQTLGMSWATLGTMFSIMLIPFILLEIPAGILADKYIGEKELMAVGMFILTAVLFLFYYIDTPTVWLWTLVLFLSRVGAALIEAMRETYFFKLVDAEDIGYINLFRTTGPLGYVIGPAIAMIVLAFLPLHYIFLVLGIIMISGFGFIYSIKDTK